MIREYWLIAVSVIGVAVYTVYGLKKRVPYHKILLSVIFILYMATLLSATMFPIKYDHELMKETDTAFERIKLVPFQVIIEEITSNCPYNAFVQIVGNIVMTIPFGVIVPFLKKFRNRTEAVLYALALPVLIEMTQLVLDFSLGTFYRTVDIDDVILNFTGVMTGYLLYRIMPDRFKKKIIGEN